jgi:pimeloyl-ACP methyl ester carboxylesterase
VLATSDLAAVLGRRLDHASWRGPAARAQHEELVAHLRGLATVVGVLWSAADRLHRLHAELLPTPAGPLRVALDVATRTALDLVVPVPALVGSMVATSAHDAAVQDAVRLCAAALHELAERCAVVASAARVCPARPAASVAWALRADSTNRSLLAGRLAAWTSSRGDGAAHAVDLRVAAVLAAPHLDPVTHRTVPVLLLGYDPTAWCGRGRVVLAYGDPQRAADVAYLVPGLGARPDSSLDELAGSARTLYDDARRVRGRSTCVVAWLGYRSPDLAQAASVERAERGAAELAAEIAALRRARGEDQPHVTVVGHSYGSVLAGLTTRLRPAAVDDLVLLGSPGAGTGSAVGLGVDGGHAWVGSASSDPVTHLSWFGTDPAAQSFGAHRFPAEPTGPHPDVGLDAHSDYLRGGSPSEHEVARVVAGDGADVPWAPGRTDHGVVGAVLAAAILPQPLSLLGGWPATHGYGDPAAADDATTGDG